MSFLNELAMFIALTEKISPKTRKSLLWRRARDQMLRKAVRIDLGRRWLDEDDINLAYDEDEDVTITGEDLNEILERALGRPPR